MNEPRRILYHHRIRADDGQAVHVRELIAALRAAGHHVDECALVPKTNGAKTAAIPTAAGPARRPGFWQRLSLPRAAVEVLEIAYNQKGRAMLRAAARTQRPDFLYERHALHCRAGLDVARELGVPLLLEVNSPMVDEMQKLGSLRFRRRAEATERMVLAGADAVLAVTQVLAELLVERGAVRERVHVIGNGAVPERYGADARTAAAAVRQRWQLPAKAFALGFVGYMRPWHRLDLVLDAMARPELRDLVLVLMGRGPALEPLQQAAAARGCGARVLALGEVPPALLPAHVLACDGALIPAINAYASPLKLFDSLAAGVPTLAPDQPNLRETIVDGDNGLLFRPGDPEDLVRQLVRLVADRDFAQRIGAAGLRSLHQQRWTWAGNAERVLAIADRLRPAGLR
ncbi:MAG: glycosyltransferase family 4 protein [Planctomycetes bacterium]|jgi:glycosyltransferase involved in cell wall biosynthesis|nr:glycosyltransferase family 4 protein [Planctomycetota bacterium]